MGPNKNNDFANIFSLRHNKTSARGGASATRNNFDKPTKLN